MRGCVSVLETIKETVWNRPPAMVHFVLIQRSEVLRECNQLQSEGPSRHLDLTALCTSCWYSRSAFCTWRQFNSKLRSSSTKLKDSHISRGWCLFVALWSSALEMFNISFPIFFSIDPAVHAIPVTWHARHAVSVWGRERDEEAGNSSIECTQTRTGRSCRGQPAVLVFSRMLAVEMSFRSHLVQCSLYLFKLFSSVHHSASTSVGLVHVQDVFQCRSLLHVHVLGRISHILEKLFRDYPYVFVFLTTFNQYPKYNLHHNSVCVSPTKP